MNDKTRRDPRAAERSPGPLTIEGPYRRHRRPILRAALWAVPVLLTLAGAVLWGSR